MQIFYKIEMMNSNVAQIMHFCICRDLAVKEMLEYNRDLGRGKHQTGI